MLNKNKNYSQIFLTPYVLVSKGKKKTLTNKK